MTGRIALASLAIALLATVSPAAEADFASLGVHRYDPPISAPAFALPDLNGKMVHLADFRGKVVVVYFWTTW